MIYSKQILADLGRTAEWEKPLPNLEWVAESDFARSRLFMFGGWTMFIRAFGGLNASDNRAQLPPGYTTDPQHKVYAQGFISRRLDGFVILSEYYHKEMLVKRVRGKNVSTTVESGKLWFGRFAFCRHIRSTTVRIGRRLRHVSCPDCGFTEEIDSSD